MKVSIRICTIGGGSGMPIVNKSLAAAGFEDIKSIVTTFDSGGDSGRMRTDERGQILAFSDYWRALISLWHDGDQKQRWEEMLRFRDGRGRNFGNIFFQFMSEKIGDLSYVGDLFSNLTGAEIKGQVIPVSLLPSELCFETISGSQYRGEHCLDDLRMSGDRVTRVWLSPEVEANNLAIKAIEEADLIIFCPGSMYGSVVINLLPKGIKESILMTKAKRMLMINIMSVANENNNFSQVDYVKVFDRYLGRSGQIDLVLMADLGKIKDENYAKVIKKYAMEHSAPIKYTDKKTGFRTMLENIATIEISNMRLRHSVSKLTKFFAKMEVLCRSGN